MKWIVLIFGIVDFIDGWRRGKDTEMDIGTVLIFMALLEIV